MFEVPQHTIIYIFWSTTPDEAIVHNIHVTFYDAATETETPVAGASWNDVSPDKNGTLTFAADLVGEYDIYCMGVKVRPLSVISVFVVPEYASGALIAIAACFVAFILFKKIHK